MAKRGVLLLLVVTAMAAGCGEEPVPAMPSFEKDVKPLTLSRCVRCHGGGGTLNADPDAVMLKIPPVNGFFDQAEVDIPNCTTPAQAQCHGLGYYAVGAPGNGAFMTWFPQMPPAPGAPLTDSQRKIIENWIANPSP